MADTVDKLKELLFKQEAATLAELERRIARVADAEVQARGQIADGLQQLEAIRRLEDESRALHDRLEQRFSELNARTGTPDALRSSVAEVIDDVILEARQTKQDDLSRALAPMLVKTIKAELKNNQAEMVEALYPITGQLVKSYVASAMRDLTNRMNRGLQSNGFMLRMRSIFSGYSMAELRLAESQRLEVEELYLIRRGSGELLARFPESLVRSNSDAHMSGVLAAINDFAATAFESDGGHLRSFDLDDFTLFLRVSPVYLLAAKCRGVAAPGVESLIDAEFLEAVSRFHEAENSQGGGAIPARLLADAKTRIESGITDKHDELSSAGLPFSPIRALAAIAIMTLLAGGGWYAWTTWEVEQTRIAARRAIDETTAMSGYPVTLEIGPRGRIVAISGLAPTETARTQLMERLASQVSGVVIEDKGLAALPAQGPDLTPAIASVRKDLGSVESTLRSEVASVERQRIRAAAIRSLERAQRRLYEALPDLGALAQLHATPKRGVVDGVQRSVRDSVAAIAAQLEGLRQPNASAADERQSVEAAGNTAAGLRRGAQVLSGLMGERTVAPAANEDTFRSVNGLPDVAELLALSAERVATVSAAALQAASIRIPEPPRIPPPTALERFRAYASRSAIFFGNSEDYRDSARAEAVLDEIARLAKDARVLVRVVGYTDERGGQTRNAPLAQSRADKVAQALVTRGVSRSLIVAVGRASGPDLSPMTGPDSANRRAEFEVGFEGEPGAVP